MPGPIDRKGFLALTGGTSLAAFLAACGGSSEPSGTASPAERTGDAAAAAPPALDPAAEPDGPIQVFTWAGYEADPDSGAPWMWSAYQQGPYGASSPLEFTFLENDAQALSKVAAGYQPDLIHPCVNWIRQWREAGLIQPLDTTLLPDWEGIPESIRAGGMHDGQAWFMPFDVGFSSLVYDADEVDFSQVGGEETWRILLDDRYRGRMSFFSDPVGIITVSHQMNEGNVDPYAMTSEQIAAAKETALRWRGNLRNYWDAQTDAVNDFLNGNVVATYAWPDMYWRIKNSKKMKGRDIRYMQPVEGRGVWVCGLVLNAASERPGRATVAMASAGTPQAAASLTDIFQYASAQKAGVAELVERKELIEVFGLDDPKLWEPPLAWPDRSMDNQREVQIAGEEVKAV
jgi:spermidine/putrescine transport system substrate-binding protein